MSEAQNRIWRPKVEPTETSLPYPSQSNISSSINNNNQPKLFTKTSLAASGNDEAVSYNKAVLNACQSYNNSPKPFARSETVSQISSVNSPPSISFHCASSSINHQQQQRQQIGDRKHEAKIGVEVDKVERRIMSPKLVHKQYNSPLDLYSMNNIRKTIEAHTELIAPGVKGINFMKSDTPINKQSEVYRMVKEEEEQRSSMNQHTISRLSPISGQPLRIPTAAAAVAGGISGGETSQEQQFKVKQQQQMTASESRASQQCSWANRQQSVSNGGASAGSSGRQGLICCECGHSIVGPFAKVQARFVHPHCFNCTTCGTSLKNTGYFTIDEKLYCEIHAKQVANMMRIPFNFATPQQSTIATGMQMQQQQHESSSSAQSRLERTDQSVATSLCCGPQLGQASFDSSSRLQSAEAGRKPQTLGANPATISTMFAGRSHGQAMSCDSKSATSSSSANQVSSSASLHQNLTRQSEISAQLRSTNAQSSGQQQSMVSSNAAQDRRFIQESCQIVGGRLPVCYNCHAQIHGPYILASRTTWCKHCSQTHFNCNSCNRSLLDIGFIEDESHGGYFCELCYEAYFAPVCSRCNIKIKGDCLNALEKKWHPSCFVCGHCRRPFGNSSFYLEDNVPYCERDWGILFTTKCYACSYPIEAGDKWIEALGRNYHSNCFRCTSCQVNLEGSTFYRKGDKPYCRLHAR